MTTPVPDELLEPTTGRTQVRACANTLRPTVEVHRRVVHVERQIAVQELQREARIPKVGDLRPQNGVPGECDLDFLHRAVGRAQGRATGLELRQIVADVVRHRSPVPGVARLEQGRRTRQDETFRQAAAHGQPTRRLVAHRQFRNHGVVFDAGPMGVQVTGGLELGIASGDLDFHLAPLRVGDGRDLCLDKHGPCLFVGILQLDGFTGVQADQFVATQRDTGQGERIRVQLFRLDPPVDASSDPERCVVVDLEERSVGHDQVQDLHGQGPLVLYENDPGVCELGLRVDRIAHVGAFRRIPCALPGVRVHSVGVLQFAFFRRRQPMRAEWVPAGVAVLAALTTQRGVHHRPDAFRPVIRTAHQGPDPVGIDNPLGLRDGHFRTQAEPEVLDPGPVLPRHVVVEPR